MRKNLIVTAVILAALAGMFFYFRYSSAIRQPLDFSHGGHVAQGIACSTCHDPAKPDVAPATVQCATCHTDRKFPERVQWIRVYRVAPDIIFPHARHTADDCAVCHVQMTGAKRWVHESRYTMDFCMKCHEQRGANNTCGACHKNR